MSQPVKNAEGVTFQLAMLTAADGSQVQCIAIVGADGMPITAWPLPEGAATESGQASIAAAVSALAQALGAGLSVTNFPASQTVAGTVNVGNFPADLAKEGGKLTELSAVLGAAADASAASDSGAFSVVALIKRGLASLTSIFGRTAPLVNTRYPVEVGNFPATLATTAAVQEVRDRLPETAHSQPLTDTQLRAAPVSVVAPHTEDTPAVPGAPGFVVLGVRNDSDAPTADDGDWTWLKLDEEGRLKVATKPASITPTVGDLAALNSAVACDVRRASNVVFHLKNTGSATMAAGTFVFEASLDSTNGTDGKWFGVQAARSNANTAATSVAITSLAVGAGDTYAWEASVNGYRWFRVRCSVAATTNSVARWTLQPGSYATEPLPVNQVSTVTATANIGTYGGVVYTDSSANLAISAAFTGTSRDAGSTVGYGVFAANAFADQAGTLYIDKSTDGTTWRAAAQVALAANVPAELRTLITTRYNRVRFVNGSVAQTAFLLTSTMQRI